MLRKQFGDNDSDSTMPGAERVVGHNARTFPVSCIICVHLCPSVVCSAATVEACSLEDAYPSCYSLPFASEGNRHMTLKEKSRVMDAAGISRAVSRLASEIVERNRGAQDLILVGIRRRGVPLAERIADRIQQLEEKRPPTGQLDITLYRDDLSTIGPRPVVNRTDIPEDVTDSIIVLVDDVLYTGRTVRAALDELIDFGRPSRVELAVLIDRGHRELPIQADYVGKAVQTTDSEIIKVMLADYDEEEMVVVVERE